MPDRTLHSPAFDLVLKHCKVLFLKYRNYNNINKFMPSVPLKHWQTMLTQIRHCVWSVFIRFALNTGIFTNNNNNNNNNNNLPWKSEEFKCSMFLLSQKEFNFFSFMYSIQNRFDFVVVVFFFVFCPQRSFFCFFFLFCFKYKAFKTSKFLNIGGKDTCKVNKWTQEQIHIKPL